MLGLAQVYAVVLEGIQLERDRLNLLVEGVKVALVEGGMSTPQGFQQSVSLLSSELAGASK